VGVVIWMACGVPWMPQSMRLMRHPGISRIGLPRVFRTVEFVLFHAAACSFRYSVRTSCGVR
jgi:hypothetical protein